VAILDVGATLVTGPSRGPASRIATRAGLDASGKAALREGLMTRPFATPQEVAEFAGSLEATAGELERAVLDVWFAQRNEAEPIAGAATALADLHAHGLRIAVISNIWKPYLDAVRSHFGEFLDEHVAPELQLFSFAEGHAKPAHDLFALALERADVAPSEAVMIGDSYAEDMTPAAALGIGTVWVLHRPYRERDDLVRVLNGEALAPSHVVSSIGEVTGDLVLSVLARSPHPADAR
jgi:HAD superfamily hydrolase (TIGR01509 family)